MMRSTFRRGLALTDILVVLVLVALLVALWVPTIARTRERAKRYQCANRLQILANALANYRATNNQAFPRTLYVKGAPPDVSGRGAEAADPFKAGGPPPNNIPAALFLLLRTQNLSPSHLICPAAGNFAADPFADNASFRSNFTDVRRNLGYSFVNPYADGYANLASALGYPIAADLNPGAVAGRGAGVRADPTAPPARWRQGNSDNHGKAGQYVLFDDGEVRWYVTPFAGINGDNIYTTAKNTVVDAPADATDSILLPAAD